MLTKAEARQFLIEVANAVVDTVKASGPHGAPGGHIYAALMPLGCRLEHFEAIMSALVSSGKVVKRGQCYFPAS